MTIINKIIDGKMYAEKLLGEIHPLSKGFLNNFNRKPCLTVILVGDNPASKIYVKNKILIAKKIDIESREILLGSDVTEDELIHHISILNKDPNVDGILVQLPLPKHISEKKIINIIVGRIMRYSNVALSWINISKFAHTKRGCLLHIIVII